MMDEHDRKVIHSSESPNWRTPPALFRALHRTFSFTVDAAADADSACCPLYFSKDMGPTGALGVPWAGRGPIFLNPPYSRTLFRQTRDLSYEITYWAQKCWEESLGGCEIVGLFPFAPQTAWYRNFVMGHQVGPRGYKGNWNGHAAMEEWRIPHRVGFLRPDGSPAGNAGVNSVVIVWRPNPGYVGPWQPAVRYWSYR